MAGSRARLTSLLASAPLPAHHPPPPPAHLPTATALQTAVGRLFPLYVQPLREGQQLQAHALYRRIAAEVQQCCRTLHLQQHALLPGGGEDDAAASAAAVAAAAAGEDDGDGVGLSGEGGGGGGGRKASSRGLAFELPFVSKFLLLAAYVASRNKPTADRAVFDPTHRQRARKNAQAHDRQVGRLWAGGGGAGGWGGGVAGLLLAAGVSPDIPAVSCGGWAAQVEAAVEAKLRGPHSFPLERLLHIFYALYAHHDADEVVAGEEEEAAVEAAAEPGTAAAAAAAAEDGGARPSARRHQVSGGWADGGRLQPTSHTPAYQPLMMMLSLPPLHTSKHPPSHLRSPCPTPPCTPRPADGRRSAGDAAVRGAGAGVQPGGAAPTGAVRRRGRARGPAVPLPPGRGHRGCAGRQRAPPALRLPAPLTPSLGPPLLSELAMRCEHTYFTRELVWFKQSKCKIVC